MQLQPAAVVESVSIAAVEASVGERERAVAGPAAAAVQQGQRLDLLELISSGRQHDATGDPERRPQEFVLPCKNEAGAVAVLEIHDKTGDLILRLAAAVASGETFQLGLPADLADPLQRLGPRTETHLRVVAGKIPAQQEPDLPMPEDSPAFSRSAIRP